MAPFSAEADLNPATAKPNAEDSSRKSGSPDNHFQFIDETGDCAHNSTQVRRHVMREVIRHKRSQQQNRQGQIADVRASAALGGSQTSFRVQPAFKKASTLIDADDDTTCGRKVKEEHGRRQQERIFIFSVANGHRHRNGHSRPAAASEGNLRESFAPTELPLRSYRSDSWRRLPGTMPLPAGQARPREHDETNTTNVRENGTKQVSFALVRSPVRTVLSAARKDPFDILPLRLNDEDNALFDFYANVMPTFSYQSRIQHPRAHNWYAKVFIPEAMKGPITFQSTILVHASSCQGWIRGIPETERSLVQRTRSIEMLRRHLMLHPDDNSDATITAILSTAAADDFDPRLECKRTSWMHLRAAMQKIRDRGGPEGFKNNRRLAMLINWQDYIILGYEMGVPSYFNDNKDHTNTTACNYAFDKSISAQGGDDFSESVAAPVSPPMDSHVAELHEQTEVFLNFLRSVESLSLTHRNTPTHSLPPSRYSTFCKDALLFQVLKSPLGIRYATSGMRKQIISRMAALLMLNVALWDYRRAPSRIECLLDGLRRKVRETSVGNIDCVEAVLQLLLECNDTFDLEDEFIEDADMRWPPIPADDSGAEDVASYESETPSYLRPWFVGRMLKVVKRLGSESWWRVNDHLFDLLSMEFKGPTLDVSGWADELREEILAAPLATYVMPSMI
ncbi:hypothetical protein KEM56_004920 [Ascosphaera pollenicola]|nr:hypothetical protein KEM56_004920 [Ascosphaera pollenicola]